MRFLPKAGAALLALSLTAAPVLRADIPNLAGFVNGGVFSAVASGTVTVTFLFSRAGFTNELMLFQNVAGTAGTQLISVPGAFPSPGSGTPTSIDISVTAGDQLLFGICTNGATAGGKTVDACAESFTAFFMGPGSNNADGFIHAAILSAAQWNAIPASDRGGDDAINAPDETLVVGFEDWSSTTGGDEDFNDVVFAFSNVTVPEPATMGLLAIGLVGLAGAGHFRRRRSRNDELS